MMITQPSVYLAAAISLLIVACEPAPAVEEQGTVTSMERRAEDELLTNARISRPSARQIRLENAAREECRGRKTILDIKVGNNTTDPVPFTAVAHGYRNAELIPVQVTRVSSLVAAPVDITAVPFDGSYPATKGAAIEIVSVTLDAEEGTFEDVGVDASFTCGEVEDTNAGYDPGTTEVQNPSAISCASLASIRGAAYPMCEFNGNGACEGRGAQTNDCAHCCQATGPGTVAPLY